MKTKDINRIVIGVKDLDKAVDIYSKILGTTFQKLPEELSVPYGTRAVISWDARIEMISPIPGVDSLMQKWMDRFGEGLLAVVFNMDDVEEARAAAEELGVGMGDPPEIELDQNQIEAYFQGGFKKFKEYLLDPDDTFNVQIILGQIEPK